MSMNKRDKSGQAFTKVKNKLRAYHIPQIPGDTFDVYVTDEVEAKRILDVLTQQHLWLYKNNIIPNFSNIMGVEMWVEDSDGEGTPGWNDYWNDEEGTDWDEFETKFLNDYKVKTSNND